jgi:hypothetical protein
MKNAGNIFVASLLFLLTACGANKKNEASEATTVAFYTALKEGNFEAALQQFSPTAFDAKGMETVEASLRNNSVLLGQLNTFEKKSGWNISTSTDEGTRVTIVYDVKYAHGQSMDSLTLYAEADGSMKIISYKWTFEQADYVDNLVKSEMLARNYMEQVITGNYANAYSFVGYQGKEAATLEAWTNMLAGTSADAGPVSGFEVDTERSGVEIYGADAANPGNYYSIIIQTNCAQGVVQESLLFFQPDYNSEPMLINHGRQMM